MTTAVTESAFEQTIEHHLLTTGGWLSGSPTDFDPTRALIPPEFLAYLSAAHPDLLAKLSAAHGAELESVLVDTLAKALDTQGSLDVIRHGFKVYGKLVPCASFRPAHGLNPEILDAYRRNRLVVTRQVRFSPDSRQSIDVLLSLNGIPIATMELKNPLTGQKVDHAVAQYKATRAPAIKLFQFAKRTLVHFAVDPSLVYMTTQLDREDTQFLPFNCGRDGGAGNPQHPSGHRTAYLWEEVLAFDSILDIVQRFIHLEKKTERDPFTGKQKKRERLVFPRYHQLDAVRRLEAAARAEGAGASYLVQHSAGSGKSNSIGWLAHRLSSLHDEHDQKVFHSVVVVTDRRVLDSQLQDTIYQFEHKNGVVQRINEHSSQLAEALETGTPIIVTTLQKFPYVAGKIGKLPGRRYAVIVDEAHGSQTGESSRKMKAVLAAETLEQAQAEDSEDAAAESTTEDEINKVMASRGKQKNLSFFAFTATPKAKTLELFGRKDHEGKPAPFHLYSMRQAIEERFILDVLGHYTTYQSFYRLAKTISDDPELDKKKATKALARFMSLHPTNIAQKVEIIIEHFRLHVSRRIGGRAKAMVVTSSRLHAVRYKLAFDAYLREKGIQSIRSLVAFSGTVKDGGIEHTEPKMNGGISERQLPEAFAGPDYQVLLVANKYQTGFDEPLLHTMYVDKRLAGVQAVQTLSRLNRTCTGKEDTFVLDFVNDAEEIRRAFQPYYEQTRVEESPDPHELYRLQHELDAAQVYWGSEVEAFANVFYRPLSKQRSTDSEALYGHLQPAVDRFAALDADAQQGFRDRLGAFVRLYAFLSHIMAFPDADLEKRYTFGRMLLRELWSGDDHNVLRLDDDVQLTHIHRKKTFDGKIVLPAGETTYVKPPLDVGTAEAKDEKRRLSEIVDTLNERLGTDFKPQDQLTIDQFMADAKAIDDIRQKAIGNTFENFALSLKQPMTGIVIDRMERNEALVTRYLNDLKFQQQLDELMARRIYEEVRAGK